MVGEAADRSYPYKRISWRKTTNTLGAVQNSLAEALVIRDCALLSYAEFGCCFELTFDIRSSAQCAAEDESRHIGCWLGTKTVAEGE